MKSFLLEPLRDFTRALERSIPESPWIGLPAVIAGMVAAWWIYVPLHELLHAFGCLGTGGAVDRLEISPQYGAALLREIFPFVAVGSDYAGQLTGFDTHGNDLIYLVTVYAPYLLTVFVGVPLLRGLAAPGRAGVGRSLLTGAALPVAYAPFYNMAGDYYELGSIVVSRIAVALGATSGPERWRSDDLFKLAGDLSRDGAGAVDVAVTVSSALLGVALAFMTYGLGVFLTRRIARLRPRAT